MSSYLLGTLAAMAPIAEFQEWFPLGLVQTLMIAACSGSASLRSEESLGTKPCRSVLPPENFNGQWMTGGRGGRHLLPCIRMLEKQSFKY